MNCLKNNPKITICSTVIIFIFFSAVNLFAEKEKVQENAYEKLKVFSEILSLIESFFFGAWHLIYQKKVQANKASAEGFFSQQILTFT